MFSPSTSTYVFRAIGFAVSVCTRSSLGRGDGRVPASVDRVETGPHELCDLGSQRVAQPQDRGRDLGRVIGPDPRTAIISAQPASNGSSVAKSWSTRTGSAELSTVRVLVGRAWLVRPAAADGVTTGADTPTFTAGRPCDLRPCL